MFGNQPQPKQPKSHFQIHRDSIHQNRMVHDREMIRKAKRFTKMSESLLQNSQNTATFILDLTHQQLENELSKMLHNRDFFMLSCCLLKLLNQKECSDRIPNEFMHKLVKNTCDSVYQPEVIAVYRCLTAKSPSFHEIMFEYPSVIKNIIREVDKMRQGPEQDLYLDVLEDFCSSYSKRRQEDTQKLLGEILEMIEGSAINFSLGMSILKSLSPLINQKTKFSDWMINSLLEEYERHMNEGQSGVKHLKKAFLILSKVIYYTKGWDILVYWRMVEVILHAKEFLPEKIVSGYYNWYLLLAKLIEKISSYEMFDLASGHAEDLLNEITSNFNIQKLSNPDILPTQLITTTIISHLLTRNRILEIKEFNESYLYLIIILCQYCEHQVMVELLIKNQFFEFIVECLNHSNNQICAEAISILSVFLQNRLENLKLFSMLNENFNLKQILEVQLYKQQDKKIAQQIQNILANYDFLLAYGK